MRPILTAAVGLCTAVSLLSLLHPGRGFVVGGLSLQVPTLDRSVLPLLISVILRAAVQPDALEWLARIRSRLRSRSAAGLTSILMVLLPLNLLLLLVSLGRGVPFTMEAVGRLPDPPGHPDDLGSWASRMAGPRSNLRRFLTEIPSDARILLASPEWRDHRAYFLAYYLYPRALFVLPTEQDSLLRGRLDFGHLSPDPAMAPLPDPRRPTDEEYRSFIEKEEIGWVILIPERVVDDAILLTAEEAFR